MARKNLLTGLTAPKLTAVNSEPAPKLPVLAFAGRGALGAVTRSIDGLAARASAARELEAKLVAGQTVVEIDPALVDASFIADRMAHDDEAYDSLRDAIAGQGQASPILLRPHPDQAGRFQVAFGHRRLRAVRELGQPVRAVIKPLTDRELVLAQGQENSARADLSFIEKARFASRLEQAGFDRETIMAALSVDKTTLSRFISTATRIPAEVIEAIGAAPATGRDRWVELAAGFQAHGVPQGLTARLAQADFQAAASDARFSLVAELLAQPTPQAGAGASARPRADRQHWTSPDGHPLVQMTFNQRACLLTIDRRAAPDFGDYLLTQMDRLFAEYTQARGREG